MSIAVFTTPIVSVLWVPIAQLPVGGKGANLTPQDILLAFFWTILVALLVRNRTSNTIPKITWLTVALLNFPLVLSPIASYLFADGDNLLQGILTHLKRIGFATCILPLAIYFQIIRFRRSLIYGLSVAAIIACLASPELLGTETEALAEFVRATDRKVGLLFNPNTLGIFVTLCGLVFVAYLRRSESIVTVSVILLSLLVISDSFLDAASRSATVALLIPALLILAGRGFPKLAIIILVAGAALYLLTSESKFATPNLLLQRFQDAGLDYNLGHRIETQNLALNKAVGFPLGVGIENIGRALFGSSVEVPTTDSLYVDYLITTGFLGLISVIAALGCLWIGLPPRGLEQALGRAATLAVALFSLSGVGLGTPFVSPIYFLIVGYSSSAKKTRLLSR